MQKCEVLWGHTNHNAASVTYIPSIAYPICMFLFFRTKKCETVNLVFRFSFYFECLCSGLGLFILGLLIAIYTSISLKTLQNEWTRKEKSSQNGTNGCFHFISHVQNNHFATALIVNCCFFVLFSSDVYIIKCYGKVK